MVPGRLALDHGGAPGRVQAGEEDGGLDLGRSRRGLVGDRNGLSRAAEGQRDPPPSASLTTLTPIRTSGSRIRRIGRLRKRRVAVERRGDRMAAGNAHHQARARARIAEIERRRTASTSPPMPTPTNPPAARALAGDRGAKRPAGLAPCAARPRPPEGPPRGSRRSTSRPKIMDRCEIDLSPGTRMRPFRGVPGAAGNRRCQSVIVRHSRSLIRRELARLLTRGARWRHPAAGPTRGIGAAISYLTRHPLTTNGALPIHSR